MPFGEPDFEELRALVRRDTLKGEAAADLAHHATSGIIDCRTGATYCQQLIDVLELTEAGDRCNPRVGALLRQSAVEILNAIEIASASQSDADEAEWDPSARPMNDNRRPLDSGDLASGEQTAMSSTRYWKRLPPNVRQMILRHLHQHHGTWPISVARMVHQLGEEGVRVEVAEATLKSSIAEAAISKGFDVSFDGT